MKRLALCAWGETYGLLDGAELLELLTQSGVIGVPGKTSVQVSALSRSERGMDVTYPTKSFDMVI
jgi:hypothetical protein